MWGKPGTTIRRRLALAGILMAVMACPTAAQTEFSGLPDVGAPVFRADVAAFRAAPDSVRLEIYYKIRNPSLSYRKRGGRFIASYEISVVVFDDKSRQLTGTTAEEDYALETFEMTRRASGYLTNQLDIVAPPGKYRINIRLTDRNSRRTHSERVEIDVSDYADRDHVIGGPQYLERIEGEVGDRFRKHGIVTVPRVVRRFGGFEDDLIFYAEAYTDIDTTGTPVRLGVDITERQKHTRRRDTVTLAHVGGGVHAGLVELSLEGFIPGDCELTLRALHAGQRVGDEIKSSFSLEWSLDALVRNDWEAAVGQLIHIANDNELDSLRDASESERVAAFEAFWDTKDPTPETVENEWRDEYYRRLAFANRAYSSPYRRGWRTDRGMVYIKYGEPDLVERFPFEMGTKPYQIWHYYEQRRRFTFVDELGNGEYQLLYPYDGDLTQQRVR